MIIDNDLKIILELGLQPEMDDIFFDALYSGDNSDEKELTDRYMKQQYIIHLCLDLIIDHKQTKLDWQYVKDNGLLCKMAEKWFEKELKDTK